MGSEHRWFCRTHARISVLLQEQWGIFKDSAVFYGCWAKSQLKGVRVKLGRLILEAARGAKDHGYSLRR